MSYLNLRASRSGSAARRRAGLQPRDGERRVRVVPRTVRLRQDDHPADDRRVRTADDRHDRARRPGRHLRPPNKRNVGMVFQSYALFPNMTVGDNVGFGLKVRKRPNGPDQEARRRAPRDRPPPDKGNRYPYQLSGGQQQRVALARALAYRAAGPAPRRAAVRAGRQDPRLAAHRDPVDPAAARDHHGLRDPRPGGGALAVRPGRRHEPGPDRADWHAVRDLQLPDLGLRGVIRGNAQRPARAWSPTPPRASSPSAASASSIAKPISGRDRPDHLAGPPAGNGLPGDGEGGDEHA